MEFKIVLNTLFILNFIGGLFGMGIWVMESLYLTRPRSLKQKSWSSKWRYCLHLKITYSDGSTIASIEGDLLRTSVASDAISDNLKAIVATEDEHFNEHKGVVPKATLFMRP